MNCWEFVKCGREGGGANVAEQGPCPAWPDHGRSCALVAGSLCRGTVQSILAQQWDSCQSCDFYKLTQVTQHSAVLAQRLLDLCPIGVIGVNRQGVITIFNPAAEEMTGRRREEVLGRAHIADIYESPAQARQVKRLMYSKSHGGPGRLTGSEVTVKGPGGRPVPIRLWGFVLYDLDKEVGNVGFFYDMSEEKRSQESRVAQEKLKSVLEMAGAVLHHLSQPLQVLASGASLLRKAVPQDDPVRESVEIIADSIEDLKHVLEKVRRVSHVATTGYVGPISILDLEVEPDAEPAKNNRGNS